MSDLIGPSTSVGSQGDADDYYDPNYVGESAEEPEFLTQNNMDYIVAKTGMSQRYAEWTARYLSKRRLTNHMVATKYRGRQKDFQPFFTMNDAKTMAFCNDIHGLLLAMEIEYIKEDWRLFIDGSSSSLKSILLHKSNRKPSIVLYYSTDEKETRPCLENLLDIIKYKEHNWKLCCDLKVVSLLAGMKLGNPNYGCFKCDWNRNAKDKDHYTYKWTGTNPDIKKDIKIDMQRVLIPSLHLKLGIVQKFLKVVLNRNDKTFRFFKEGMFKRRTDIRIKSGIYKLNNRFEI